MDAEHGSLSKRPAFLKNVVDLPSLTLVPRLYEVFQSKVCRIEVSRQLDLDPLVVEPASIGLFRFRMNLQDFHGAIPHASRGHRTSASSRLPSCWTARAGQG